MYTYKFPLSVWNVAIEGLFSNTRHLIIKDDKTLIGAKGVIVKADEELQKAISEDADCVPGAYLLINTTSTVFAVMPKDTPYMTKEETPVSVLASLTLYTAISTLMSDIKNHVMTDDFSAGLTPGVDDPVRRQPLTGVQSSLSFNQREFNRAAHHVNALRMLYINKYRVAPTDEQLDYFALHGVSSPDMLRTSDKDMLAAAMDVKVVKVTHDSPVALMAEDATATEETQVSTPTAFSEALGILKSLKYTTLAKEGEVVVFATPNGDGWTFKRGVVYVVTGDADMLVNHHLIGFECAVTSAGATYHLNKLDTRFGVYIASGQLPVVTYIPPHVRVPPFVNHWGYTVDKLDDSALKHIRSKMDDVNDPLPVYNKTLNDPKVKQRVFVRAPKSEGPSYKQNDSAIVESLFSLGFVLVHGKDTTKVFLRKVKDRGDGVYVMPISEVISAVVKPTGIDDVYSADGFDTGYFHTTDWRLVYEWNQDEEDDTVIRALSSTLYNLQQFCAVKS
jgi:hypothetical protein